MMSSKSAKLFKSKLGSISNESIDTCDTVFGRINVDQSNCCECEMILSQNKLKLDWDIELKSNMLYLSNAALKSS
jgi:NADPH-dependent 7-cyano-7-deazaguanine reductase QueF-like protein